MQQFILWVWCVPDGSCTVLSVRFQDHINNNPLDEVLVAEELLKLKAEAGAAPPGFTLESDPVITPPPGFFNHSQKLHALQRSHFGNF